MEEGLSLVQAAFAHRSKHANGVEVRQVVADDFAVWDELWSQYLEVSEGWPVVSR